MGIIKPLLNGVFGSTLELTILILLMLVCFIVFVMSVIKLGGYLRLREQHIAKQTIVPDQARLVFKKGNAANMAPLQMQNNPPVNTDELTAISQTIKQYQQTVATVDHDYSK